MGAYGGQYRMNVVWSSHAGQVLTTMGQIQSGMRTTGGVAQRSSRDLGAFNRQMQAVGTTFRYMFAGGAIFGSMNAFRQFAEFESKLGDIAAISEQLKPVDITAIGNRMLQSSTATATPVVELEQSLRNIQSTLSLTHDEVMSDGQKMWEGFSKGAKVSETDAYNFGNAIMAMKNAFNLSLTDMDNISGQFFTTISKSAGMTGDEWAKFSGRVVAGAGQANISLEEMNAMMILMTRQGATASTNVRHLHQFLAQVRNPTQESIPFWEKIGLSVEDLRTLPFETIMQTLMRETQKRGGLDRSRTTKFSEEEILAQEELDMPTGAQLGFKGENAASMFMDLFGRTESRRAVMSIVSQRLHPAENVEDYDELLRLLNDTEKQADAVDKAFERWLDRNRIQQAGIALRNMMTEAIVPFEPKIKRVAEFITDHADPRFVQGAAIAAGGYGLYRLGGNLKGMGRFLRGAGVTGIAASAALSGQQPTGSVGSPFFVYVLNPGRNLTGPGSGTGGSGAPGAPGGKPMTRGERLRNFTRPKPGAMGRGAGVLGVGLLLAELAMPGLSERFDSSDEMRAAVRKVQNAAGLGRLAAGPGGPGTFAEISNQMRDHGLRMSGQRGGRQGVHISADLTPEAKRLLDIKITDEGRGLRKRVNVPTGHNAFQGGATPQFRGKDSVPRGGL